MKKYTHLAVIALFVAGMAASACKKGNTVGAVGFPDIYPEPQYDTFIGPYTKYYFYGKFDGKYIMWQDSVRSVWDTATRDSLSTEALAGQDWSTWPLYNDNIYYNFCEGVQVSECRDDSDIVFYQHRTRFIRPDFAERRIELNFYDCIDLTDATNPFFPFNEASFIRKGANPFSNPEFAIGGVQLIYIDEFRQRWITRNGSGDPTETYLRVLDFEQRNVALDTNDTFGLYIVEGSFAGKLYNEKSPDEFISVIDARFKTRLVRDSD